MREVARATGFPSATLGGYFSGRHLPPATQPQVLETLLRELGVTDAAEQAAWRDALQRARRGGPARVSGRPGTGSTSCPYRGLEPFTDADEALFFGREQVVADLTQTVVALADGHSDPRMLMVVGASGSGKSSVLRAGLVAQMRQRVNPPWAVSVIVPDSDPITALRGAKAQLAGARRALLVVDQAEEVFSPLITASVRRQFIAELLTLADPNPGQPSVVVVVALRADFYGQAAADPNLVPILRTNQVLLGAMSLDDLRRAVVTPASRAGVEVDPELVELLVRDLHPRGHVHETPGYEAGALPLVSHALQATWTRHHGQRLTVADYLRAGGIAGAVAQTAETAVATLDERGLAAAQWLFGQLILVDDDGVMTRRRVDHDDLHHPDPAADLALDDVIEAFVSGRLLTADDHTLEISHEALLTAWPRLREWVLNDLDTARLQRRIADAAASWRERNRDPGALARGGFLADAQALATHPFTSSRVLAAGEQEYVAASAALATAEAAATRRRTRRLKTLVAVMTVLALIAATLTAVSLRALADSNTARNAALSRQLAITADQLRGSDPALAAQLSLAAYRSAPTLQARSSLLDSTGVATPTRFAGPSGDMHTSASPDGELLAVSGVDGVTRLWRKSQSGSQPGQLPSYSPAGELASGTGPVYASAFSPDGHFFAVGAQPGKVVLWDLSNPNSPARVADLGTEKAAIYSLAFNHDGTQLAAGTSQPGVRRWVVTSAAGQPRELPAITGFSGSVHSVAYAPVGDVLATGSADGNLRTWDAPTSGTPSLLGLASTGDPANFVLAVTFSPDGRTLVTGDKGRSVRLWELADAGAPKQADTRFAAFGSWVNAVAYSPDGKTVAAASSDGFVQTYRASDGQMIAKLPGPGAFTAVQFVAAGDTLLTAEVGGTARLWPFPGPTLTGYTDSVWNVVATTPEPLLAVAAGREDGHVYLYDTSDPAAPRQVDTLAAPATAGAPDGAAWISPDGRWIAAGTAAGRVVVWERDPSSGRSRLAGVEEFSDKLIEALVISEDGTKLAAIADDNRVGVWHLQPGTAPKLTDTMPVAGLPLAIAFNPDASLLAVGSSDRQVHLWPLGQGNKPTELPTLTGFENYVYSVTFDPTGRYLAAGSTDRTIRIWDITDPTHAVQQGRELRGPQDTVYFLDWSRQGDRLAAAATGGTLWLWDVTTPTAPRQLAALDAAEGNLFTTTFTPDGTGIYAAGSGRTVTSWNVDLPAVLSSICTNTGTPMTQAEWERLVPGVDFTPPCPQIG